MGEGTRPFSLRDRKGNFIKYTKGEVVLYRGDLYEVLRDVFARVPDQDSRSFRLLTEETDISIIDGGVY
jgi:hypothetical protein